MKTLQSILASTALVVGLSLAPALLPAPAFAVDNMSSTDAPDLTSVRAKIKAHDYAAALPELRDLAEDVQQADVYNLLGFTLRKTGDFKTSLTYYANQHAASSLIPRRWPEWRSTSLFPNFGRSRPPRLVTSVHC
jgi:hypothetical protein